MLHRVKTNEIFTPTKLVNEMLRSQPEIIFAPGKTVLDPACGDGQFLVEVKRIKMDYFQMTIEEALQDIYGVDIMRDNVDLCKKRLGGGNIVMGNTLDPNTILPNQLEYEYKLMRDWFGNFKNSLDKYLLL